MKKVENIGGKQKKNQWDFKRGINLMFFAVTLCNLKVPDRNIGTVLLDQFILCSG